MLVSEKGNWVGGGEWIPFVRFEFYTMCIYYLFKIFLNLRGEKDVYNYQYSSFRVVGFETYFLLPLFSCTCHLFFKNKLNKSPRGKFKINIFIYRMPSAWFWSMSLEGKLPLPASPSQHPPGGSTAALGAQLGAPEAADSEQIWVLRSAWREQGTVAQEGRMPLEAGMAAAKPL